MLTMFMVWSMVGVEENLKLLIVILSQKFFEHLFRLDGVILDQ